MAIDASGDIYVGDASSRVVKITPGGFVATLAGQPGQSGLVDGSGPDARFSAITSLTMDSSGNLFVGDGGALRKISPAGNVTTVAGGITGGDVDGTGSAAGFVELTSLAADSNGNVYVSSGVLGETIRKVAPGGVVTTVAGMRGFAGSADGLGSSARFYNPTAIATDSAGNVYVCDTGNATIRKITPERLVSTLAGSAGVFGNVDGTGSAAAFTAPFGLAIDNAGNLFVADDTKVREVTQAGVVTTLFGGPLTAPSSWVPLAADAGFALDPTGVLFGVDSSARVVLRISTGGSVTAIAGSADLYGTGDGTGGTARFGSPRGSAFDSSGNLFVADSGANSIREISPSGKVTTLAGSNANRAGYLDGAGSAARFNAPNAVAVDGDGNVYVADVGNNAIRKVTPGGQVTTLAGSPTSGSADGSGTLASFNGPEGIAVDGSGNVFVADTQNSTIRRITPDGAVTTFAGVANDPGSGPGSLDGTGSLARFNHPVALAIDSQGNLYVADGSALVGLGTIDDYLIRRITPGAVVTTLAGSPYDEGAHVTPPPYYSEDGTGSAALFRYPSALAVDAEGNVYVADTGNATIRRVTPGGTVTTLAGLYGVTGNRNGAGSQALFSAPSGIAVDKQGNLYVSDSSNSDIYVGSPNAAPSVSAQPSFYPLPASVLNSAGGTIALQAFPSTSASTTYQWYFNGAPIAGATGAQLVVSNATPSDSGYYDCVATNALGVSTLTESLSVQEGAVPSRLINLSCRAVTAPTFTQSPAAIGTGSSKTLSAHSGRSPDAAYAPTVLIPGFVIGGSGATGTMPVLVRDSGPALSTFGVSGFLPDPAFVLQSTEIIYAIDAGWQGNALVAQTAEQVGAFTWNIASSADSAAVATLPTGAYTVQMGSVSGDSGIVLAEVYDATPAADLTPTSPRLINLSARAEVGPGADTPIAGFVIGGSVSKTVLIRVSGPALASYGLTGLLPDPQVQLYRTNRDGSNTLVAVNGGWAGSQAISAAASEVGAFPWGTSGSPDAAILISLAPGAYTAVATGVSGDAGLALVEIYDVP
jgi:sugar lactone lactonase YvrE